VVLVIIGTSLKLDAVLMDDLHPGSVITAFALNKASTIYYWVDDILLNFSSSINTMIRSSPARSRKKKDILLNLGVQAL